MISPSVKAMKPPCGCSSVPGFDFKGVKLPLASMIPTAPGFPSRAELVARYTERSGRDVRHIGFYHVLGLYRLGVIAAQIFVRFHRGQTRDQRFAAFGPLVGVVAAAARERAGRG